MATNSDVLGLSIGITVVGLDAISATGIALSAMSTAGAAAATGAANSSAIGALQTQVTELRTEGGMLKGDMEATKVDVQTVKADAVTTKSAFTKFVGSTELQLGTLQGQVTDIYANKANKEDVYNKGEIDAHFETQDVTNQTVNLSLGNLGILKANVQDVYDKNSNDQQLSLKANSADVYSKTQIITNYYDKIDCGTMFQLKSDSDIILNNMMSLINNLDETKVNVADVYTNIQVDTKLQTQNDLINTKANIMDVYTKVQIDLQQQTQDTLIGTKANVVDVYTKTQIDSQQKVQNDAITLIQTKDSVQDNDIANMKIDVSNNNTNVQNCMIKVTENTNDIKVIKSDIVTLKNSSNNIPGLSNRLTTLENQYLDQNIIVNGTKNYLEQTLIPEQTTQNNNISTLQIQMSSVIGVNNDQASRLSTIENSISSDQTINNQSFTLFGLTFKFGKVDVGSGLGQKYVTFVIPFKYVAIVALVTPWGNSNDGSGCDTGQGTADVNGVTVTADYANSGGNNTNTYSWLVIGM
ncbi:Conserved_hypothetical protein [Hexamita inflata]|uniref:Uncharacterized protein n=1 Tax=Hexamita inflata TaxID=28002 RepID=A0AA86TDL4_9EUKA|nr:Conserved hypothetical protein [Hexamita inflata]